MNKEVLVMQLQDFAKSTKVFVTAKYHQLAEYLSEKRIPESTKHFVLTKYHQLVEYLAGFNALLGMRCIKYLFVLLNIFYLVTSLFLITFGVSGYLNYDNFVGIWFETRMLSIFGLVTGFTLMILTIFGIIGAFKESTIWANIYGVLMMFTFTLQGLQVAAVAALSLMGNSNSLASRLIYGLMDHYDFGYSSAQKLDWIQKSFDCCGAEGPSDWINFGQFALEPQTESYYFDSTTTMMTKYRTPISCCTNDSGYKDMTCDNYKQNGCTAYVSDVISESIMIIGTVSLTIAVIQILGIVCAFTLARLIRRTMSYRHVQKWDTQTKLVPDAPTYVKYEPLNENEEIKHT